MTDSVFQKPQKKPEIKPELKVHRIYTKSSLFESASVTPALLENPVQPVIDLEVNANVFPQEKLHEVVLLLKITAKHNSALLWRVELQQAGFYELTGFALEIEKSILNGFCMNQLYPYACAEANHWVNQGGFGTVYLQPINFEQLYKKQQKTAAATNHTSSLKES